MESLSIVQNENEVAEDGSTIVIGDKSGEEEPQSVAEPNNKENVETDTNEEIIKGNCEEIDEKVNRNGVETENVDTKEENTRSTTENEVNTAGVPQKIAENVNTDTGENDESEEKIKIVDEEIKKEEESDGEIVDDSESENAGTEPQNKIDYNLDVPAELDQLDYDEDIDDNLNSDTVQLGKSQKAEKTQENVMSEGEIESSDGEIKSDKGDNQNLPLLGFYPDEREDGEMVDPMEGPAVPREICRFFERGSCTWGDRCRFIHPGINDKGEYRMFDDGMEGMKQMINEKHLTPAIDPRDIPPNFMDGPPQMETAWERGLRHAKEMRKRSMQRKVEEPDFMRKREIISTNEALNVDRDMDFIAHKPLVDDMRGFDPFADLDADERYAVPPPEVLKRLKRFERRDDTRSPGRRESPSRRRGLPPPMNHNNRRRSPPRPHMHPQHRDMPPFMRQPNNNFMDRGPPFRDGMEGKPVMERRRSPDFRREVESRVIPAQRENKSPRQPAPQPNQLRGDNWQDPWARGRQKERSKSHSSSSGSSSSGSSSRSSYSSRSSSFSSRSSSRSSDSSSFSDSGSSHSKSPGPKKSNKKVLKKKKNQDVVATKKTIPAPVKVASKPPSPKKSPKSIKPTKPPAKPVPQEAKKKVVPTKTTAKAKGTKERGRTKTKTKGKRSDSSSTSEFSHSSSSSRSRSRSKSGSESGSSSSSGSGSSSGSSSESLSEDEKNVKKKKNVKAKPTKVSVPSKPGGKNVKMTIINKPKASAKVASSDSRKRSAAQMSNPPTKKVSAIANRRVELLEQLKVVENAILKKRAKLT